MPILGSPSLAAACRQRLGTLRITRGAAVALALSIGLVSAGCTEKLRREPSYAMGRLTFHDAFIAPLKGGRTLKRYMRTALRDLERIEAGERVPLAREIVAVADEPMMPYAGFPGRSLPVEGKQRLLVMPEGWRSVGIDVLSRQGMPLEIGVGGSAIPVDLTPGQRRVLVTRREGRMRVCIDGACRWIEPAPSATAAGHAAALTLAGTAQVHQVQVYGDRGLLDYESFADHPMAVESRFEPGRKSAEWSSLSRYLAESATRLGILRGVCADSHLAPKYCPAPDAASRATVALRGLLWRLAAWPAWRPTAPGAPGAGKESWHRSTWSSGYLPLAVAVAAVALREELSGDQWQVLRDRVSGQGAAWVGHETFPPVAFWLRRATNHAAFIYAGAGAAALLMSQCRPEIHERRIVQRFFELQERATVDGGYVEGPGYLRVFLRAGFILPWLESRCVGGGWAAYRAFRLQAWDRLSAFVRAASDSEGRQLAVYGDGNGITRERRPWPPDVLRMLQLADPDGRRAGSQPELAELLLRRGESPVVSGYLGGEGSVQCEGFDWSGFAVARVPGPSGPATVQLNSTRLHLTHNADFDLNSITLEVNGLHWITEDRRGNDHAAYRHNGIALRGITLARPESPTSACGAPRCGKRETEGRLLAVRRMPQGCLMSGSTGAGYLLDDGGAVAVERHHRHVLVMAGSSVRVLLVDLLKLADAHRGATVLTPFNMPLVARVQLAIGGAVAPGVGRLHFPLAARATLEPGRQGSRVVPEYPGAGEIRVMVTLLETGESASAPAAGFEAAVCRMDEAGIRVAVTGAGLLPWLVDAEDFQRRTVRIEISQGGC